MTVARAYFTSLDASGKGNLWVSDGTTAGTSQIPTVGGISGLYATGYAVLNSAVYFSGFDGALQNNLFKLDGTGNAVTELLISSAASSGLSPSGTVAANGKLFFAGTDAANHNVLWRSDGTAAGTAEIALPSGAGSYYPLEHTAFGAKLAFNGEPSTVSTGLYLTDGTSSGTSRVTVNGASSLGLYVSSIASLGTALVFGGLDAAFKNGLWVSDGTTAGTSELSVPSLNPSGGYTGRVAGLLSFGSKAGFTGVDAAGKYGIWVTDGTPAGTIELPGVYGNSYGAPMAAMAGNRLAFIGSDANGTAGIYITDGTAAGTVQVPVPGAAQSGLAPHALIAVGNRLLFDGLPADGARGLFISDGTAAGTSFVKAGINLIAGNIGTDAGVLGGSVACTNTVTGLSSAALSDIYTGPVSYLQQQYIWSSDDGVAMRADAPGIFLKGGAGGDALLVTSGSNVLDGGSGSNFLVGAAGSDGGSDTFFVDERGNQVTWSTIVNFHQGDQATIFGFHAGVSTMPFTEGGGATGYTGLTLHAEINGAGTGVLGSMTFTGISQATADAHWTISTGTLGAGTAAATDYLLIQWDH